MKQTAIVAGAALLALSAIGSGTAGLAEARGDQRRPAFNFDEIDLNGDGLLAPEEINAQRQARFAATDSNGDGNLSVGEMTARAQEMMSERIAAGIARRIARQDKDGDGMISLSEAEPPEQRSNRMFARLDQDDDGAVSRDEFETAKIWRRGYERGRRSRDGAALE
ncbi:MAG: EF-hand domain-containing protein [Halocynthiibacter sp.]